MIAQFSIAGTPVAKGRPRISARGGFARAYTPAKTRSAEAVFAAAARGAMRDLDPYPGAVELELHFRLPIPKSWSKRDRELAALGRIRPTGKPDWDNFGKLASDAMNGIVYADDAQVVGVRVTKYYDLAPRIDVLVTAA